MERDLIVPLPDYAAALAEAKAQPAAAPAPQAPAPQAPQRALPPSLLLEPRAPSVFLTESLRAGSEASVAAPQPTRVLQPRPQERHADPLSRFDAPDKSVPLSFGVVAPRRGQENAPGTH